ncbi:unnamed protein product [Trypanosoma congolense IL3000]|uniref:WGS project CAEQ00000000 data, annotated contig 1679 n=1 Tax=Trypanosoma congolense (strain IL3000) TaxID=1068625 RepID=F9W7Z5_TRYCI|nr:unnamed protein product [Trypanosoma congolense IL3000]
MRLFQEVRLDRLQNHPAAVMGAPEPQPKISKVCLPACTQTAGPPPASSASTQASPPPSSAAETQTVPPPLCSNDGRSGADSAAVTKTVSAVSAVTATTQTNVVATKVVETQTAPLPVLTADAPPSAAPQEKVPVVTQSKSSVATQTIGVISPATDGATAPTSASLKDSGSTSEWKILVDFSLGALDMLASHFGEYVSNTEKVLNLSEREMEQMRQEGNKKSKVVWESLVEEKQVELDRLRDEVKRLRNLSGSAKGNSEESTAGDLRGEDSKVSMLLRMYVKYAAPFIPPRFKAARNTKLTPIADMRKAAVRAGARCVNAGYSPVREEKAAAARPKGNEKTVGKDEGSDSRSPSVQPVAVNVSKRIIAGSPAPSSSLPNRCVSTDDTLLSVASQKAFIVPVALPPVRKTTNKNLDDDSPVVTYKESPEERKSAPAAGKEERKAPVAGTKSTTKTAAPSSTAAVSIGGGVLTVRKFNKGGSPSSSSSTTPRKAGKTAPEASRKAPVKEETDDDSFDRNEKPKVRAQQTQPRKQSKTQPPATDSWSDSLSDVSEPRKASAKQPSNVDVVARNSFDVTSEDDVKDPPKKAAVPSSAAAKDDKKTAGKTEQKGKDHAKQRERRWSESSSSEEDTKFKKIDTFGAKKAAQSDTKKAATTHADKIGQKGSKKSSHSFDDSQSLDSSLTLTL